MAGAGPLYRQGLNRISGLDRDLDYRSLSQPVPACPDWTVKDVVSHLSGVCTDIVNGNLDGVATDPWTAAQVEARRERPIRSALSAPGERSTEAIGVAFPWLADRFGRALASCGSPALRFVTAEGDEVLAGEGEPGATVRAPRFEFFRALTGRRSVDQIEGLGWEGDAGRYVPAFEWGPFRPAAGRVEE